MSTHKCKLCLEPINKASDNNDKIADDGDICSKCHKKKKKQIIQCALQCWAMFPPQSIISSSDDNVDDIHIAESVHHDSEALNNLLLTKKEQSPSAVELSSSIVCTPRKIEDGRKRKLMAEAVPISKLPTISPPPNSSDEENIDNAKKKKKKKVSVTIRRTPQEIARILSEFQSTQTKQSTQPKPQSSQPWSQPHQPSAVFQSTPPPKSTQPKPPQSLIGATIRITKGKFINKIGKIIECQSIRRVILNILPNTALDIQDVTIISQNLTELSIWQTQQQHQQQLQQNNGTTISITNKYQGATVRINKGEHINKIGIVTRVMVGDWYITDNNSIANAFQSNKFEVLAYAANNSNDHAFGAGEQQRCEDKSEDKSDEKGDEAVVTNVVKTTETGSHVGTTVERQAQQQQQQRASGMPTQSLPSPQTPRAAAVKDPQQQQQQEEETRDLIGATIRIKKGKHKGLVSIIKEKKITHLGNWYIIDNLNTAFQYKKFDVIKYENGDVPVIEVLEDDNDDNDDGVAQDAADVLNNAAAGNDINGGIEKAKTDNVGESMNEKEGMKDQHDLIGATISIMKERVDSSDMLIAKEGMENETDMMEADPPSDLDISIKDQTFAAANNEDHDTLQQEVTTPMMTEEGDDIDAKVCSAQLPSVESIELAARLSVFDSFLFLADDEAATESNEKEKGNRSSALLSEQPTTTTTIDIYKTDDNGDALKKVTQEIMQRQQQSRQWPTVKVLPGMQVVVEKKEEQYIRVIPLEEQIVRLVPGSREESIDMAERLGVFDDYMFLVNGIDDKEEKQAPKKDAVRSKEAVIVSTAPSTKVKAPAPVKNIKRKEHIKKQKKELPPMKKQTRVAEAASRPKKSSAVPQTTQDVQRRRPSTHSLLAVPQGPSNMSKKQQSSDNRPTMEDELGGSHHSLLSQSSRNNTKKRDLIGATIRIKKGRFKGLAGVITEKHTLRHLQVDTVTAPVPHEHLEVLEYAHDANHENEFQKYVGARVRVLHPNPAAGREGKVHNVIVGDWYITDNPNILTAYPVAKFDILKYAR